MVVVVVVGCGGGGGGGGGGGCIVCGVCVDCGLRETTHYIPRQTQI